MTTPAEFAAQFSDLDPDELEHLQRLLGAWSLLSDLSFSDLLLLIPVTGAHPGMDGLGAQLLIIGQIRPNNRPTNIEQDLVGQIVNADDWELTAISLKDGSLTRGKVRHPALEADLVVENVPVRFDDKHVAVMVSVSSPSTHRPTALYERMYMALYERLGAMIMQSAFPFPDEDVATEETPRVGDGIVVVDEEARVEFASPNAMNAFHRMGVYSPPESRRFSDLGIEETAVEWALATGRPVVEEVERRPDVAVLVHCIPLIAHGSVTGAMILLRDVTDVRRLDRLLLSKDAAIREVHHRVKNNLQTISSLLSLQARRVDEGVAREALREAERRVRSIALVHEILSRDPGDQVPFAEIAESLVQMARDSVVSANEVEISIDGTLGDVAADIATPLAVAVAELLQNAVEHAFGEPGDPSGGGPGQVLVVLDHGQNRLRVDVIDDGCGLGENFNIDITTSLGLSIVRDLIESQLEGSLEFRTPTSGSGTQVSISVPLLRQRR